MAIQQLLLGTGPKTYEVERSLRFNYADSPYLVRTPSSTGNEKVWTFSAWIKRTEIGSKDYIYSLNNANAEYVALYFQSDKLYTYFHPGNNYGSVSDRLFRDTGAWFHIVHQVDALNTTQKIWINGTELSLDSSRNPSNNDFGMNQSGVDLYIGKASWKSEYNNMYLAETYLSDGNKYQASDFGETNSKTGQWVPKKFSGSYGTNGFHLKFSDNSNTTAATLGKDYSGNGNNFTPNNFSVTAGKDDDSSFDSPTNNFPTLSPVDRSLVGTMSNGSLRVSYNYKPASKSWRSTMALPSSGKIYWEWENEEASSNPGRWQTGLVRYTDEAGVVDFQGYNDVNYVSISYGGSTWNGTTHMSSWPSFTFYSGERAAIAIDCSNGKLWVGKVASNGSTTWYANDGGTDGDPAGGTNESFTIPNFTTATEWMPHIVWHDGGGASSTTFTSNINFGNHSFLGTVPTGFKKLCSANFPEPTIAFPNQHFGTLTWTGNATVRTISDTSAVDFTPDMVWVKCRSASHDHQLTDSVRGTSKALVTNSTGAEVDWDTEYSGANQGMGDYTNGGFGLDDNGNNARYNANSETYVAWNWKAGGSASSNGNGSITSSVSANTTAGFSIVSYEGTGSLATVGHGLGVKPDAIIFKNRDQGHGWLVYHKENGATKNLSLNTTAAVATASNKFNDTEPTSTVFTVNTAADSNQSGQSIIAYCFSEVAGFSKFGSYIGNGNADGTFVFTGFRPAYVMVKKSSGGDSWLIMDNKRDIDNVVGNTLAANSNGAENADTGGIPTDFLSNGFKCRGSGGDFNADGSTFIYLAFAESPFKYSRAQ